MERNRVKITEGMIQSSIRDFLRQFGWFVVRCQQGLGCHKGLSDLIAVKNGKTIFIEVKTPKGTQSPFQKQFQKDVEQHGAVYILAKSLEDIQHLEPGARLF